MKKVRINSGIFYKDKLDRHSKGFKRHGQLVLDSSMLVGANIIVRYIREFKQRKRLRLDR
jgi:hypothetical protein